MSVMVLVKRMVNTIMNGNSIDQYFTKEIRTTEGFVMVYASHFHKAEDRLMVVNTPECILNPTDSSTQGIEEAIRDAKAKTETIKNKFVNLMSKAGMTGEFVALEDKNPGHAIVQYAGTVGASFIVTGSRGLSKFRRTLLGSVSDYIIHHSPVPVLVCRSKLMTKE